MSIDGLDTEGLSIDSGEETKRSPKKILKREVSLDDDGLPRYLSKIGTPTSSSSGASGSSGSTGSTTIAPAKALDAHYLKALQQMDPDFVEEAYQTAASYHAKAIAEAELEKKKLKEELEKKKTEGQHQGCLSCQA